MPQPLCKHLEELPGEPDQQQAATVQSWRPRLVGQPDPASPSAGRIGEAYARGYEEGLAAARSEARAELAALAAECDRRIEATERTFAAAVARDLSQTLQQRLEVMHATIEGQVVSVLVPVVRHVLTEATVRELAGALRKLTGSEAVSVELSGPKDLVDRVRECLVAQGDGPGAATTAPVRFRYSDATEVSIECNGTLIESRLVQWMGRIAEAVR